MTDLQSKRLLLRPWRESDREPFAAMNADPAVMQHYPATLSRAESDALLDRLQAFIAERGFGIWAIELPGVAPLAGFVGLIDATFEAPFNPCVEIGWRLATPYWGKGYAREGAELALRDGFERLGLEQVLAWTVPANTRSWRLMEALGMERRPDLDFEHPRIPEGHALRRHVVYRATPGR